MAIFSGGDTALQIVIRAKDEASKTIDSFKGKLEKMQPTFKKMAVGGTAAFAGIAAASAKAVKAFQAQERSEARLIQLTKQTTNATDAQILSLQKQAQALQKVGVIGDEVTMFGQSQLATFALQTDTIEELTPGLLDLAVATKGVNATQEDMINIGNLVGKVMGGQVGALSRLGITFSEAQEEILKTGTEMEKATTLASVLSQNFGGLNESTRATSEGGMAALKNSFGDMQESIGAALVPLLNELVTKLVPIIDKIGAWVQENPKLTKTIILVGGGLAALVAVVGTLGLILPAVITGFGLLFSPMVGIALAAGAIVLGTKLLVDNWDKIGEFASGVWGGVKESISNAWGGVKQNFSDWVSSLSVLKTAFSSFWNHVGLGFKTMMNGLIGLAEGWANLYVKAINTIIKALNKIQVSIPKWVPGLGGKSFGINLPLAQEVQLPKFQHGGLVNAPAGVPVPAILHGQERVIPANRGGGFGGSTNITVNINNPTIRSTDDIRFFKDQMEKAIRGLIRDNKLQAG